MVRIWRHLKLLKRGGRGHDPSGTQATSRGELAVVCPACQIPGVNLPEGWRDDLDKRYAVTIDISQSVLFLTYLAVFTATYTLKLHHKMQISA